MRASVPSILLAALLILSGCQQGPSPTPTASPPTPTPVPLPATATVCSSGCDFSTVQAAIDDDATTGGAIIEIRDPVHTEVGIVVGKNVTIRGQGPEVTTVQAHAEPGSASDRVFHIKEGTDVTIKGMAIRHGHPSSSPHAGGGIWNQGTLRLHGCIVSSNTAADGGGIWNQGRLTAINCTIRFNTADADAPPGYECGSGGGINNGGGGMLTLIDSSVTNNEAAGKGGGIHVACESTVALINGTISGNKAARRGGGAHIGQLGTLNLTDSTVSGNTTGEQGSGIHVRGTLNYTDTVIVGCIIGGPGDFRGTGVVGIANNTKVEDNDCRRP